METVFCSYCGKVMPVVKNGTRGDIQRYKCKECGHSFILQKTPYTAELKYICKAFYRKGFSYRKIAEIFLIKSHNSVANWCEQRTPEISKERKINVVEQWSQIYALLKAYYRNVYNEKRLTTNTVLGNQNKKTLPELQEKLRKHISDLGKYENDCKSCGEFPNEKNKLLFEIESVKKEIRDFQESQSKKPLNNNIEETLINKQENEKLLKGIFKDKIPNKITVEKAFQVFNEIMEDLKKS